MLARGSVGFTYASLTATAGPAMPRDGPRGSATVGMSAHLLKS